MKLRGKKSTCSTDLAKKQFYFEHIKRWLESNISQKEYCKEHDVKLTSLMYWRKKYLASNKIEAVKNNSFTQIKIRAPIKPKIESVKKYPTDPLTVRLPNGLELVLPIEAEEQRLISIVQSFWRALC